MSLPELIPPILRSEYISLPEKVYIDDGLFLIYGFIKLLDKYYYGKLQVKIKLDNEK